MCLSEEVCPTDRWVGQKKATISTTNFEDPPTAGSLVTASVVDLQRDRHSPGMRMATCPSRYVKPNRNASTKSPNSYRFVIAGQQQDRCNWCKVEFPFRNMTVDHVRPQSRGGADHLEILHLLCDYCNSLKRSRVQENLLAELAKLRTV